MKTVIGLFGSLTEAQVVIKRLIRNGFKPDSIGAVMIDPEGQQATNSISDKSNDRSTGPADRVAVDSFGGLLTRPRGTLAAGIGPVLTAGPLSAALTKHATGGLIGALVDVGITEEKAQHYAEGVRRGAVLITVNAADELIENAAGILQGSGALDVDKLAAQWRQSGWTTHNPKSEPHTQNKQGMELDNDTRVATQSVDEGVDAHAENEGEVTVPIVEEELQVEKRQVQHGSVRVRRYVTEIPVEEKVELRQENLKVDRRPADRPASEADFESFKEGTLELVETSEEVVVSKRARVVEEIVIAKEVSHRTETVRDKVRRMNVQVEKLGSEPAKHTVDFEEFENDLRNNYKTNFSKSEYSFDDFLPAYRYGYTLANDKRYSSGDWRSVEPDAQRYWEESNQGTWEEFKNAVRYAWEKVRDQS
jgi:uncharacterized protein (TIGR02271 family)